MTEIFRVGDGAKPLKIGIAGCGGAGCNSLKFVSGRLSIGTFALNGNPRKGLGKLAGHSMLVPGHELLGASDTDPRIPVVPHLRSASVLASEISGTDVFFSLCGLGGNSGWRCAALASRVAKEAGAISVCIAILPFSVEAPARRAAALEQAKTLRRLCDGLLVLRNDRISQIAPKLPFLRAMEIVSELALLVPHEVAAAGTDGDRPALKSVFSRASFLKADVATAIGGDRGFELARALVGSEWMELEPESIKSGYLLVGGPGDGDVEEAVAAELRNSAPNLEVLAFGRSGPVRPGERKSRACALIGVEGELH
ncbi:MAG: hypothetical protein V1934_02575 [Methanobacteriota archaeon]